MRPDPRIALSCYLCWYAVLWIQDSSTLVFLPLLQFVVFVAIGGLRSVFWRVVKIVAFSGAILSILAYLTLQETPASLCAIWGKWGSVVMATVAVASVMSMRDLFIALRWCRVPRDIVFPLGVALKFLPVTIDETQRCILSLRARGLTSCGGLSSLVLIPRLALDLWVPLLANILERAQRTWFSMELRGYWDALQTSPADTKRCVIANTLVILWAAVPIVALLMDLLPMVI